MVNKYNLTREQNIYLAKRLMVDSIWKSANLEGIAITFPETDTILKGINNPKFSKLSDILTIINLKRSWEFLLDNIDYPVDFNYIRKINSIVGQDIVMEPGNLRMFDVKIGGTTWKPPIPDEEQTINDIDMLNKFTNPTERAIETMLYLMRNQLFYDGNKRTATLIANHIMIQNGVGIISIPVDIQLEFINHLIDFYETNNSSKIKEFVCGQCIEGITFKEKDAINLDAETTNDIQQGCDSPKKKHFSIDDISEKEKNNDFEL